VLLLAAYSETLARWGAGSRFTLTTTVANRPPIHPRIDHAIGNFSETLLVEVEIDRQLTFQERAKALQARLRRDLDHRHFNGIEVLRELGRRTGAGQAQMPYTFNSAIGYVQADLDGSALELFGPEVATSSQTPQLWLNAFAFEQHGGVIVQFDAVDGLFPEGLIEDMVAGYHRLLDSLLADEAWNAVTFDLLPEAQRERRRVANDTAAATRRRPAAGRLPGPGRGGAGRRGDPDVSGHDDLRRAVPACPLGCGLASGAAGRARRTRRPGDDARAGAGRRHPGDAAGRCRVSACRRGAARGAQAVHAARRPGAVRPDQRRVAGA